MKSKSSSTLTLGRNYSIGSIGIPSTSFDRHSTSSPPLPHSLPSANFSSPHPSITPHSRSPQSTSAQGTPRQTTLLPDITPHEPFSTDRERSTAPPSHYNSQAGRKSSRSSRARGCLNGSYNPHWDQLRLDLRRLRTKTSLLCARAGWRCGDLTTIRTSEA